ncbi:DUF5011 domain-containing protein [Vagococcus sp. BWB3-3]|uniref:DUF5011 domain-containing protein n=1 Tax=Vagococcus allomyrinae TaxID=2794353 RepID=A0A940SSN6_9ENTE|nr:immunoglobulin-like domain-containing protein [Vagococcus allomyrinae]MBP1039450.1 DUF5011 domain-containing protein [Vagococcus allomyrinae]
MKTTNMTKNKGVKYLMLASVLASTALAFISPATADAAELSPEVTQVLSDQVTLASGVSYIDTTGQRKEIAIPTSSPVTLSATSTTISVKFNGQTHKLTNVRDVTFKNITVPNLIPFYLHGVTKVTLEGVNFQKGVDFSGMKDIQSMIVKNSTFGATDYSFAIHSAPALKTLVIDGSSLNADLRIYSNKTLTEATVSNSVLKDDANQYSNQKGFRTNYINTRVERPKGLRCITSGGMSAADIFFMNPNGSAIGASKFDASKPGKIFYSGADGVVNTIDVPAYVTVTTVNDVKDAITIKLSNGYSTVLNGTKELYFRNVDIQTHVAFTQKGLRLESLKFVNSRTRLIDVAYSETMHTFDMHASEVSQSSGYVSVYNNKAVKNFVMTDSQVKGSSGYISTYNMPTMENYIMNNDYTYGYLSTYNLGAAVLKLSNSQFDDYISSTNVIEGEAERPTIGYAPIIEAADRTHVKGDEFNPLEDVKVYDFEDGDLISSVVVDNQVNESRTGVYPVTYTITDSDNNVVTLTIQVTVVN